MASSNREAFRDFAREHGYELPADIVPGKLHRFAANGKPDDDAAWCKLFPDLQGGVFGDWRTGSKLVWQARRERQLSPEEWRDWQQRVDQEKRRADEERQSELDDAASRAEEIWNASQPAPDDHGYLTRKGVKPNGTRIYTGKLSIRGMDCGGALIVPLRDTAGRIRSLEFIGATGEKRFLPGGSYQGCYFSIGGSKMKEGAPLCIAEGFATGATVHEATGYPVVTAMTAGNLEPVARGLREKYGSARLVVCADDDARTAGNPGISKAREAVRAVGALLAIPDFGRDRPEGATDFNDLQQSRGGQAVAACISGALRSSAQPAASRHSLPVVWLGDAKMPEHAPALVKGLVDPGSLALIYGESGSGKTFFTQDMFSHVACGLPWRGRKVEAGTVAYVAVEAGRAILRRFVAWRDNKLGESATPAPLAIFTAGPNLLDAVAVAALLEQLRALSTEAAKPLAAVIFDTLSRSIPGGDENRSEDMTSLIEVANQIRDELSAATVLVHHTGKDPTKGARGHSSLFAAADVVIAVSNGCATVEKLRDGVAGEQFTFSLDQVQLGTDPDGDPITTCLVNHTDVAPVAPKKDRGERLSGVGRTAMQALQEAVEAFGEPLPQSSTIPRGVRGVAIEQWRDRFSLRYGSEGDDRRASEAVKKAFQRGREALLKAGVVGISDPYAWLR
jgi:phage/plasmid primase-like uncharacterized protein/KaiC/GvpD/RAD55 family RecA-like ATPase